MIFYSRLLPTGLASPGDASRMLRRGRLQQTDYLVTVSGPDEKRDSQVLREARRASKREQPAGKWRWPNQRSSTGFCNPTFPEETLGKASHAAKGRSKCPTRGQTSALHSRTGHPSSVWLTLGVSSATRAHCKGADASSQGSGKQQLQRGPHLGFPCIGLASCPLSF